MSPDLKTGVTRPIFFFSGMVPFWGVNQKMHFNGSNKELKFCYTKFLPELLPPFKGRDAVFISSSDKVTSSKELLDPLRQISNYICDWGISHASFGPTLTKYHWDYWEWFFSKIFLLNEMFWSLSITSCNNLPSFLCYLCNEVSSLSNIAILLFV